MTAAALADSAGIARSHLSHVLKGEKSLGPEKIRKLAEITGAQEKELLQAAGYLRSTSVIDQIVRLNRGSRSITVITDPRFLDSALFLWLFRSQTLEGLGIEWIIQPAPWDLVPRKVDQTPNSIGFYNRRREKRIGETVVAAPAFWADLSVYEGYALIARKADVKDLCDRSPIEKVMIYLKKLMDDRKPDQPVIVSIEGEVEKQLGTPLTKELGWDRNFDILPVSDPDEALRMFLGGAGDFFVGGLPQRHKAELDKGCVSLISLHNDPFLFSLNSLICSQDVFAEEKILLGTITSVWFEVCTALRSIEGNEFRASVYSEIDSMLLDELHLRGHSITFELMDSVFGTKHGGNPLEFFPRRPAGVVSRVMEKLKACAAECVRMKFDAEATRVAIEWISEFTIGPPSGTEQDL